MDTLELALALLSEPLVPVIIMTPEMDHYLVYKITDVVYSEKLKAVVIDIQRSL